jgi:hypothetical protein
MHPDYRGIHNAIVADIAVIRTLFPIAFSTRVRPISLGSTIPVSSNERVTITGKHISITFNSVCHEMINY